MDMWPVTRGGEDSGLGRIHRRGKFLELFLLRIGSVRLRWKCSDIQSGNKPRREDILTCDLFISALCSGASVLHVPLSVRNPKNLPERFDLRGFCLLRACSRIDLESP
jgi:hypothetical protein